MTDTDLVRASRDGDQFHYYWAARRCLEMLSPTTDLVCVSIEGAAIGEVEGDRIDEGLEVIDIAEYRGGEALTEATSVVYRQLKHSTVRTDSEITMSQLRTTLSGFAKRFHKLITEHADDVSKVTFELVSNRLPSARVRNAIADVASGKTEPEDVDQVALLKRYLGLKESECKAFCNVFKFDDRSPNLLPLMQEIRLDVAHVLPGAPVDAPLRLKEIITLRATTRGEHSPEVRRSDVLAALGTDEQSLLPAPARFEDPPTLVDREEFRAAAQSIVSSSSNIIVHAPGGVGKTVFATTLASRLPTGSCLIAYDCFGAGGYRRSSEPRHEHRQGVIQICNELAGHGLCEVVLPTPSATPTDYYRVLNDRLRAAGKTLEAINPGALLVVAIDAADNAVMAALEFGSAESFVVSILRESTPANVRLVVLCRTERISYLKPQADVIRVELQGFNLAESAKHLEGRFPQVQSIDTQEFHDRTGANPRVQALAMSESRSIEECLTLLGQTARAPQDALDRLIGLSVERIKDRLFGKHRDEIDHICEALATLRPRLPVRVIADLYGINPDSIRSFSSDLGRPLLLHSDVLQFRDEPTETWFRITYKPTGAALGSFVQRLRPLAETDAYVAASLPQILWEAGQFDELVGLAMTDNLLPHSNSIERSEIEFQRIRFALNSAMRIGNKASAVRLAMRTGALTSGQSRRMRMIASNTDLAGAYLDTQSVEDLCASRKLRSDWPGANLAYEGALLAAHASTKEAARSRLRSAYSWMQSWTQLPDALHEGHMLQTDDIAEIAFGLITTDGAASCTDFLASWTPDDVAYRVGCVVASRLIDSNRMHELTELLNSAHAMPYLQLAVTAEAARKEQPLSAVSTAPVIKMLEGLSEPMTLPRRGYGDRDPGLTSVLGALVPALRQGLIEDSDALPTLDRYMTPVPPRHLASRTNNDRLITVQAWALRAMLRGVDLEDLDLAHPELRAEIEKKNYSRSQEQAEYFGSIVPLIPWAKAWALASCGREVSLVPLYQMLPTPSRRWNDYSTAVYVRDVAYLAARLLSLQPTPELTSPFESWMAATRAQLPLDTLIEITRFSGRARDLDTLFYSTAAATSAKISESKLTADESTDWFLALARAVRPSDPAEAEQFWDQAMETADRIGDDVYHRWNAISTLSTQASSIETSAEKAYNLTRVIEALNPYTGDSLDFSQAIRMISRLDKSSAVATAARWRDREVGYQFQIADGLFNHPDSAFFGHPVTALALTPLSPNTFVGPILNRALQASDNPQRILDAMTRHSRSSMRPPPFSEDVTDAVSELHLTVDTELHSEYKRRLQASAQGDSASPKSSLGGHRIDDVDQRFETAASQVRALALEDPAELRRAHDIADASGRAYGPSDLANEIVSRAKRLLAPIIATFSSDGQFDWYETRQLVDALVDTSDLPAAARKACRDLVQLAVQRFSEEIVSQTWGRSALEPFATLAGRTVDDLFDTALLDLGGRNLQLSSEQCFSVATVLTAQLTSEQALTSFHESLKDLNYLVEDGTADGVWIDSLKPAADLAECAAGYLWSALASPDEEDGWRATHSLKLMLEFGVPDVLEAVRSYADSGAPTAFFDHRFAFYQMHAEHRLLLALEHLSVTHPVNIEPFRQLLVRYAARETTHVLFRESARRALLTASTRGGIDLDESQKSAMESLNQPTRTVIELNEYRRPYSSVSYMDDNEVVFQFRMDFSEYWIAPLARCFGVNPHEIENRCADLILDRWTDGYTGDIDGDGRHAAGVFAEGRTSFYKYESPAVHDLSFYLSYHALMTVAADLIDNNDVYRDKYDDTVSRPEDNAFNDWLQRNRPTCGNGLWLFDRRDAVPADQFNLSEVRTQSPSWTESIDEEMIRAILMPTSDHSIVVWQDTTQSISSATESTTVSSALVRRTRSKALLAAMGTADASYDLNLPVYENGYVENIEAGDYAIHAWVDCPTRDHLSDRNDPLNGNVDFPAPKPGTNIRGLLDLHNDDIERIWTVGPSGPRAFTSTTWNNRVERSQSLVTGPYGSRLVADQTTVTEILAKTDMDLIFKVTVDRYHNDDSGRRMRDDDDYPGADRSFRVLLLDRDGNWTRCGTNTCVGKEDL